MDFGAFVLIVLAIGLIAALIRALRGPATKRTPRRPLPNTAETARIALEALTQIKGLHLAPDLHREAIEDLIAASILHGTTSDDVEPENIDRLIEWTRRKANSGAQ